jgi:NAD(P)-dependent dehydrogenase (short-subunit alcohol dehydrogenase family)
MRAIILGDRSDIAQQLIPMLKADGWEIEGWNRDSTSISNEPWDLVICMLGRVAPVGFWAEINWEDTLFSNLTLPIRLLRIVWSKRNPGASVCFFAGANPNKPMENYSAYSVGKMALLKACEHLDLESPDVKFFALAPGVVLTKIHQATIQAGIKNERLQRAQREGGVPVERIYACLKWCIAQPKEVIGGRNICVSDKWDNLLAHRLMENQNLFKLRRCE